MNFEEKYALNDSAVTGGVWRTLRSGLKVKVASLRNPAYLMEITRLKKEYANILNLADSDVVDMITCKAMAKIILLDWDGATDDEGNAVPYSVELGETNLKKYEIFREEISAIAATDGNYKPEIIAKK